MTNEQALKLVPGQKVLIRGEKPGTAEYGTLKVVRDMLGGCVQVDVAFDDGTLCWVAPDRVASAQPLDPFEGLC